MKSASTQIHDLTLPQLAEGLRAKRFSSREIVKAFLDRIDKANGKLHAFVDVYREEALALAEAADKARAAGLPLGPLHGLPVAVKDLCDIEGKIGTGGSAAWRDRRGKVTATAVRRLMDAGMIPLGKTHMVEFAFGTWGTNPLMGAPWNPWDLKEHRAPGGSSSGSGVAVAAGLAPFAIGSDTGGSVRIPAAVNGIVGLKTTAGRISLSGCIYLSYSLDTLGPMVRSVEDAALAMQALAGPDLADPTTLHQPESDYVGALARPARGMRLAVIDAGQLPPVTDPAMRQAMDAAAAVFVKQGIDVVRLKLPDWFLGLAQRTFDVIAAEAYHFHCGYIEDQSLAIGGPVRTRVLGGKSITAADYVQAARDRVAFQAELLGLLGDFDGLMIPTCPHGATALKDIDEKLSPLATFTRGINFLGLCGLSMPAGFDALGLPLSIQLVGKPFDEPSILRLGKAFQDATEWNRTRPDLSSLGL